jgi:hypothetical protein
LEILAGLAKKPYRGADTARRISASVVFLSGCVLRENLYLAARRNFSTAAFSFLSMVPNCMADGGLLLERKKERKKVLHLASCWFPNYSL